MKQFFKYWMVSIVVIAGGLASVVVIGGMLFAIQQLISEIAAIIALVLLVTGCFAAFMTWGG